MGQNLFNSKITSQYQYTVPDRHRLIQSLWSSQKKKSEAETLWIKKLKVTTTKERTVSAVLITLNKLDF